MNHEDNQETENRQHSSSGHRNESVLDESHTGFDLANQVPKAHNKSSDGLTQVMKRTDTAPQLPEEQFGLPEDCAENAESVYDETVTEDVNSEEEAPTSISANRAPDSERNSSPPLAFDPHTSEAVLGSERRGESAARAERPSRSVPEGSTGNSRLMLILLASYASAITIALVLLLMRGSRQHQLESLPDVTPEPAGQITFVPVDAELPDGHLLSLGSRQRFGNILVEPLRVTQEPVNFTHYSGDTSRTREPSRPVMKLWLRFTNASTDQTISPIDRDLVLRWVIKRDTMKEYTNQFVRTIDSRTIDDVVPLYRLPPTSEWDLADQNLGLELEPGESFETYIASSDEGIDSLQDKLLWRLQFRKGFSSKGNGVTTLIDVAFDRTDVQQPAG